MKKGFGLGWFLLGAALLTPYAAEKNEETGEYEIRSLLLKVKTKKRRTKRATPIRIAPSTLREFPQEAISRRYAGIFRAESQRFRKEYRRAQRRSRTLSESPARRAVKTRTSAAKRILKTSSTTSRRKRQRSPKRAAKHFEKTESRPSGRLFE